MKQRTLIGILVMGVAWLCVADPVVYTFNFTNAFPNGGVIPDGNLTGWSDARNISGVAGPNVDVNVWLNLSGGHNGDLYGYLVHDSGFAVLLNRIGRTGSDLFGNTGAGMNVTLDDDSGTDIHLASYGVLSGTYNPDARTDNPALVTDSTANRDAFLSDFDGLGANGSWTLFLADLSVGEQSSVISWGVEITAVPEPSTWALLVLGLLGLGACRCRS